MHTMTQQQSEAAPDLCNHTSVGVLLQRESDGKYLLFTRKKYPWGKAPSAGHVDELTCLGQADEAAVFEAAAHRELEEETGLHAPCLTLALEAVTHYPCRRINGSWHKWRVYHGLVSGQEPLQENAAETRDLGWYSLADIAELDRRAAAFEAGQIPEEVYRTNPGLEQVWRDFFRTLGLIQPEEDQA